ncbi:MAG: hypothetical protein ABI068_04940, partial [Ktedonobacterales bacterium]
MDETGLKSPGEATRHRQRSAIVLVGASGGHPRACCIRRSFDTGWMGCARSITKGDTHIMATETKIATGASYLTTPVTQAS